MRRRRGLRPVGVATVAASAALTLLFANAANAATAPGALQCSLPRYNPTKYALRVSPTPQTVTCVITGASDASGLATVSVFIKSSNIGNATVTGTVTGSGSSTQVEFTYTAAGNGCNT